MTTTPEAKIDSDHALDQNESEQRKGTDNKKSCGPALCPRCQQGVLEYNGLLELTCPKCGYREPGGGFT
jgi:ribosomal protein S27AE